MGFWRLEIIFLTITLSHHLWHKQPGRNNSLRYVWREKKAKTITNNNSMGADFWIFISLFCRYRANCKASFDESDQKFDFGKFWHTETSSVLQSLTLVTTGDNLWKAGERGYNHPKGVQKRLIITMGSLSLNRGIAEKKLFSAFAHWHKYSHTHKVRLSGVRNLSELIYTYTFWDWG